MLLGCKPRTRLDLLKPHTAEQAQRKQNQQKAAHDSKVKVHLFDVGDLVYVKNLGDGHNWDYGLNTHTGLVSFHVKLWVGGKYSVIRNRSDLTQLKKQIRDMPEKAEQYNFDPSLVNCPQAVTDENAAHLVSGATTHATDTIEPVTMAANAITAITVMPTSETVESSTTLQDQNSGVEIPAPSQPNKSYLRRIRKALKRFEPGKN